MSAATEPDRRGEHGGPAAERRRPRAAAAERTLPPRPYPIWQGAGLLWVLTCLAALAVGLWPQVTCPSRADVLTAPLPTLEILAVAQALFILLAYPMVVLIRAGRSGGRRFWPIVAAECGLCMLAAAPFYLAAAYLGDATVADTARTAISVVSLWPVAWAASAWLVLHPRSRPSAALALLVVAIGLPGAFYVTWDLVVAGPAAVHLWHAAPATFVYQSAAARCPAVLPTPLWAWFCWPAVAAAAALGLLLVPTSSPPQEARIR